MREPLKVNALMPSERTKVCDHPGGFAYSGSVPCTGPRVCSMCGWTEYEAKRARDEKELRSIRAKLNVTATMTIVCPSCDGEGGDEGPVTCTGRCDWCGGCRDYARACETCEGRCEIETDELDADHILERVQLMRRAVLLRHAMAAEVSDFDDATWTEIAEWGVKLAHELAMLLDGCEDGDVPTEWK